MVVTDFDEMATKNVLLVLSKEFVTLGRLVTSWAYDCGIQSDLYSSINNSNLLIFYRVVVMIIIDLS